MNEEIKFGPVIGGSTAVYQQLRAAGAHIGGTKVEITIPGAPRPFVTETLGTNEDWASGEIMLGDQKYFLGDMSNGYPNHNWKIRVEVKPTPKPWHDAKRGEVWVVESSPCGRLYANTIYPKAVNSNRNGECRFVDPNSILPSFPITDESIVNAYRIWPVA